MGNTGAHSAIEMALLDLAGRASGLPLAALVGGAVRGTVAPMWLLGNATVEKDVAEARAKTRRGLPLLQAQGGHQAARARTSPPRTPCARRWARPCRCAPTPIAASRSRPRGAMSRPRARPGCCSSSSRSAPTDLAGLEALARASPVADRRRRGHPFAGRHRGARARGARRPVAQADQARRLRGGACRRPPCASAWASRSMSPPRSPKSSIGSAAAVHLACAVPSTRLGREPHAFLSGRGHRQQAAAAPRRPGRASAGPGLGVEVDEAAVARLRVDLRLQRTTWKDRGMSKNNGAAAAPSSSWPLPRRARLRCRQPAGAAEQPKRGGTLVFGINSGDPPTYDCHQSTLFPIIHLLSPHYSNLLRIDIPNYPKVVGDLAESWTVADDAKTYTFRLRAGVKFHDGSAVLGRGREGDLRPPAQSAAGRGLGAPGPRRRHRQHRHARSAQRRSSASSGPTARCSTPSPTRSTASTAPPSSRRTRPSPCAT